MTVTRNYRDPGDGSVGGWAVLLVLVAVAFVAVCY